MAKPQRRNAHVLIAFTDAGTGESFEVGATPMIESGAFANYEAAGLVQAHSDSSKTPTSPRRSPSRSRPSSRRAKGAAKPPAAPAPAPEPEA